MRVLVNAASAHMGGAVTYLKNLVRWLTIVAPDDHFVVYVPNSTLEKLGEAGDEVIELRPYPYPKTRGLQRLYFDQVELPRLARKTKADVLFSTTGFGTLWSRCPQVLLVRNMAYFDPAFQEKYRELDRSLAKNTLRRWHSLLSISAADVVLFPTEAMREMVAPLASTEVKRLEVIHYGFDHDAFSKQQVAPDERAEQIDQWKADGYAILLNVSTYAVQKNFETLVEAIGILRDRGVKVKWLTTISRDRTTDKAEYDALIQRADELGVLEDIVELGYVPYDQLAAIYRLADLYVFPSFSESFGHSMVEAMASGLPVVAAGTAVNREVCGEAGSYFDSFDPNRCAVAIAEALDAGSRKALSRASKERARAFSWHAYFEQLVGIFRGMARSGSVCRAA